MKEESEGSTESITKKRLREKITSLPRSRLPPATDVLTMIWNGVKGPLESFPAGTTQTFPVTPTHFPNWDRVKLALLRSIRTGTFTDVQFYAYSSIGNNLPLNPRPFFTSSIVIEEWGAAITTRK